MVSGREKAEFERISAWVSGKWAGIGWRGGCWQEFGRQVLGSGDGELLFSVLQARSATRDAGAPAVERSPGRSASTLQGGHTAGLGPHGGAERGRGRMRGFLEGGEGRGLRGERKKTGVGAASVFLWQLLPGDIEGSDQIDHLEALS